MLLPRCTSRLSLPTFIVFLRVMSDITSTVPAEILGAIMLLAARLDRPIPPSVREVTLSVLKHDDPLRDLIVVRGEPSRISPDVGGWIGASGSMASVNKRWRATALSLQEMWAEEIGLLPGGTDDILRRTGQAKLHITIHGWRFREDARVVFYLLGADSDAARRVETITIFEHRRNVVLKVWAPLLNTCDLRHVRCLYISGFDQNPMITHWNHIAKMRSIERLELWNVAFNFIHPQRIRELRLGSTHREDEVSTSPYMIWNVALVPNICEHHATLQTLELDYAVIWAEQELSHDPLRRFPRLKFPELKTILYRDRTPQPHSKFEVNTVARTFDYIEYEPDTFVSLKLHFPSIRGLKGELARVFGSLRAAGTPTPFGLRFRIRSGRSVSLAFYIKPSSIHALLDDDTKTLDATFQDSASFCPCIIRATFSSNRFQISDIIQAAVDGLENEVRALEVAAYDNSHFPLVLQWFNPDIPSRWVYEPATDADDQFESEQPYAITMNEDYAERRAAGEEGVPDDEAIDEPDNESYGHMESGNWSSEEEGGNGTSEEGEGEEEEEEDDDDDDDDDAQEGYDVEEVETS